MSDLNPQQEQAVAHVEGPLLVLAGAGSGKTRVVTFRIAHLLSMGVLPSDILAVTFTNKAADEMRERILNLQKARILACTFHSLGARILRESIHALGYQSDFTIYDEDDSEKLLKSCLQQLNVPAEKGFLKTTGNQISNAKNHLLDPDQAPREIRDIYACYQHKLKECNALDFDDLLYLTVKMLQEHAHVRAEYQNRWLFVSIDEYQDTNLAQYTMTKILVEKHQNIFAVGDPDQSIYSWRGANYQNILNFEQDFPGSKVITLDQNYRSTNNILQGANALIQHNMDRYDKKLWSSLGVGAKIGIYVGQNEREEAHFVTNKILQFAERMALDHIAIFYRTNAQSRIFEDALLSKRIDYQIIGGLSFYQRKEIKDILSYLKLIVSNADLIAFLRTINTPKRGLGAATLEKLTAAAVSANKPIIIFCEEIIERPDLFKLSPKQKEGLKNYLQILHSLRDQRGSLTLSELISEVISKANYLQYLQEDPDTFEDRKENLDALVGKAAEWQEERGGPLQQFLEELALHANWEAKNDRPKVQMMTLHNSKGMEFELVFIVGLEEDLFPHINAMDDPKALEEERRLCYVGMTRAKRHLFLCAATYRFIWGVMKFMKPARFFKEIPAQFLENYSPFLERQEFVSEEAHFEPGDQVMHNEFGLGVVQKSYQGSLGLMYEIYFLETKLARTLAAKFAKLSAHIS